MLSFSGNPAKRQNRSRKPIHFHPAKETDDGNACDVIKRDAVNDVETRFRRSAGSDDDGERHKDDRRHVERWTPKEAIGRIAEDGGAISGTASTARGRKRKTEKTARKVRFESVRQVFPFAGIGQACEKKFWTSISHFRFILPRFEFLTVY